MQSDSSAFLHTTPDPSLEELPPALGIDSTVDELPLHTVCLSIETLGTEAAQVFEAAPKLPGILLMSEGSAVTVLSRQSFLEFLLHPHGLDLFLSKPLRVLHSYARTKPLTLSHSTPILAAARAALRRPVEFQEEPILVTSSEKNHLLSSHDLNRAHWQIRGIEVQVRYERTQAHMLQNQKMVALGRLVDGVAHEMLDPLSFIWGNLAHVAQYCQQLLELVQAYEDVLATEAIATPALTEFKEEIELEYLAKDLPDTIRSIRGGAERLRQLALSLQNFCHIDEVHPKPADLHELLDSIVLLIKSHLTTRIEIVKEYTPLPPIACFAGQLSQVFMNILTHCVDALLAHTARQNMATDLGLVEAQAIGTEAAKPPRIRITTKLCSVPDEDELTERRWVSITIADNGPGLSAAAQQRILNTFSIEQRLEKETDLARSYRIVTAKHGGRFYLRSCQFSGPDMAPDMGTEFEVHLPLYTTPDKT
ncbi:MAG: ATP-binding protein [Cyanobacteria bacterium J06636_16]